MAILYGVGVGPGDPEQLTLKAVRIIKQCNIIAVPSEDAINSVAYKICVEAVPEIKDKQIIGINMPMTRDEKVLSLAHEKAADQIIAELEKGNDVAFLTLGDSTVYSTFYYIQTIVSARGYNTGTVNGISSFMLAASKTSSKLVIGNEQLHIIPGFNKNNNYKDMPGNVIILKAGKNIREIKESLLGIKRNVYFVENCGMDNELIKKGAENIPDTAGYYSMVIIESE